MKIKISEIKVGSRHRKDFGDIEGLAENIATIGLLQPIGITKEHELIFGARRLEAHKKLKLEDIEARILDIEYLIDAEFAENNVRKEFTIEERVAIADAVAKSLEGRKGRPKLNVPNSAPLIKGKARDIAAQKAGLGGHSNYEAAKKVLNSGDKEAIEAMNKTGIVNKGIQRLKNKAMEAKIQKQRELIASGSLEIPTGKYDVIVLDPPWQYGSEYDCEGRRCANPYPEMSLDEIRRLKLPCADNCVLFLWTTHKFMRYSFDLLDSWGFRDVAIITWVKNKMGLGSWLRSQSEFCIMSIKGSPQVNLKNQTTVIYGVNKRHSQKPDEFYEMVDGLCFGRKLDYFSREPRDGWVCYGKEAK